METQDFVNVHGLARQLMLPCKWLLKEAKAGRIPSMRIGHKLRFSVEAVRETLAERAYLAAKATVQHGR